jgi:hypothetical protein
MLPLQHLFSFVLGKWSHMQQLEEVTGMMDEMASGRQEMRG